MNDSSLHGQPPHAAWTCLYIFFMLRSPWSGEAPPPLQTTWMFRGRSGLVQLLPGFWPSSEMHLRAMYLSPLPFGLY